jgi:integrase/transposase-like protein
MSSQQRNKSPWVKEKFEKTSAFSKAFDLLHKSIIDETKKVSVREKIVRIVVFAICRGGLAKPTQITQLINRILQNTLELKPGPIAPYVEFKALNENDAGNEGFCRWFIDTETLATIHALYENKGTKRLGTFNEKSLFKLIKARFISILEFKHISSLKMFCEAGAMYMAEHPDIKLPAFLISYATGMTKTTSVSQSCWNALFQKLELQQENTKALSVQAHTDPKPAQYIPRPTLGDNEFLSKLRLAIQEKDAEGVLKPIATTYDKCEALKEKTISLKQTMLLEFFIHGLKKLNWKRSSANTYLSHLGSHWFSFTSDIELESLDEYEMTELFEAMVYVADGNISQSDKVSILKQFFAFGSEVFGLALPVFEDVSVSKINNIRNYVISESNFMCFINQISAFDSHQTLNGQGLILTAILMARCGLRPSEVLKLRLKDVEPSAQCFIFTRQNRFGTNKSYSAKRKIPLSLMLMPEELALFISYLKRRLLDANNQRALLLFSSSVNANLPYSLSDFHKKFSDKLSEVCGEHVHTYHLRHKALSTLQIIFFSTALLSMTPYSDAQIARIRGFFGVDSGRDALHEIACFAGHLSPETTLKNYLHFTDAILYERLTTRRAPKHRRYWENLSALSKNIITRRCYNAMPEFSEIQTLLLESLCGKKLENLTIYDDKERVNKFVPPHRKVTYAECLTAMRYLDTGSTISEVADQLDIEDEVIEGWYGRAVHAAELKTSKGKPRLFPAHRNPEKQNITPVIPASKVEQQRAEQAINSARQLYQKDSIELTWFVQRVITNAMNSHSYLQFDDINEFYRFMDLALKLTHISEWKLELDMPSAERSRLSDEWKKVNQDLHVEVSNKIAFSKKFELGRARLHFLHPRKLKSDLEQGHKRYSSNIVKYVCHILAIMIPGVLLDELLNEGTK